MEMNGHLISDLNRFVDERCVTLSEAPGHVKLNIVRPGISLSVLIPRAVLEWWVEVSDMTNGAKVEDWCDYAGYNAASAQTLAEDMRTDVLSFVENAVARPLRTVADGRVLEWNVGGDWLQAVPLAAQDTYKEGLAPVIAKTSSVLILGSLPGDMSLRMQQYYANPRNHFWQILGAVFGCTLQTPYEEKIQFVLARGLGLWDVLKAADRKGSLDANIAKAIPNEFGEFLTAYPNIKTIALNGGKAAAHFRSVQRRDPSIFAGRQCIELPSSSGVPGKNVLPLHEKITRWTAIRVAE